jgi:hypothetical protein
MELDKFQRAKFAAASIVELSTLVAMLPFVPWALVSAANKVSRELAVEIALVEIFGTHQQRRPKIEI